ncbi:DNA/RNA polymerase [Aspergillus stella-maris]|uniref:DNA/RNA polymerase n=1 Tax=Aspergillus stella-maris TaxID=1810926 RepID=UPI003CCD320D
MSYARESRYTYRHLRLLQQGSPRSPLRVIALVDYDAFYAQCESVRLGLPPTVPLAVQQWNAVIALNYAAREHGLSRGMSVDEVKEKCPDIVLQHVATWREGSPTWAYRSDVLKRMKTDKAALDPYRVEARRTMALVRACFPAPPLIERASIDEIFIDLSSLVYQELVKRHPEVEKPPSVELDAHLPVPQLEGNLEWNDAHVQERPQVHLEVKDHATDWDEIASNIGSQIINNLRQEILRQLKYTCSAGIAPNKMLAKLAAGRNKPNGQTVVLPGAVSSFLSSSRVTKIRGLGRILGRHLVREFETDQVSSLLSVTLPRLQSVLGLEAGRWVYDVIRGIDRSEVVRRIHVQSMLSAKTFVPKLPAGRAMYWLRIFIADLLGRIHELEAEGYELRPTTLALTHHIDGRFGPGRSRQVVIPAGMPMSENSLMPAAQALLMKFAGDTSLWPCQGLSLRLSGFEVKPQRSRSISSYFAAPMVRGAVDSVQAVESSGSGSYTCPHCSRPVPAAGVLEHLDWHLAMQISEDQQQQTA